MKSYFLILATAVLFMGCGNVKRAVSGITGEPFVYCYRGVTYLQFPSGATPALATDGKPLLCN